MLDSDDKQRVQELMNLRRFSLITFPNTQSALQAEKLLNKSNTFPFIIIPVTSMISSSCGLSIKTTNDYQEALAGALKAAGILIDGVFNIDKESGIINRVMLYQ